MQENLHHFISVMLQLKKGIDIHLGPNESGVCIEEITQDTFKITVPDEDHTQIDTNMDGEEPVEVIKSKPYWQAIQAQVDRKDTHPLTMKGVAVYSRMLSVTTTEIVVQVIPVS